MKPTLLAFGLIFCAAPVFAAPGQKQAPVYFDKAQRVFEDHCIDCHNSDIASGGLDLSDYRTTMNGGASGAVVEPMNSGGSKLFSLINHESRPFMPPKAPKISKAAIDIVRQWIDDGARFDKNSKVAKKKSVSQGQVALPTLGGKAAIFPVLPKWQTPKTRRPAPVLSIAHSPVNAQLAISGYKRSLVLDSESKLIRAELGYEFGLIHELRFSRRGDGLLIAGGQGAKVGKAALWNVATGKPLCVIGKARDAILAADVREDLQFIATGGPSKTLRVFRVVDQECVYQIKKHTNWITKIEFSPDGVLLASADRNGGMFLWESETGMEFAELKGHSQAVTAVSWRLDSNLLASGSNDGQIILWRADDGANIRRWAAHKIGVTALQFNRNGEIASVGRDHRIKIWNQNGKLIGQSPRIDPLPLSICWSHDQKTVFVGLQTGSIIKWKNKDQKLDTFSINAIPERESLQQTIAQGERKYKQQLASLQKQQKNTKLSLKASEQKMAKLAQVIQQHKTEKATIIELRNSVQSARESLNQARRWQQALTTDIQRVRSTPIHSGVDALVLSVLLSWRTAQVNHTRTKLKDLQSRQAQFKAKRKRLAAVQQFIQAKNKERKAAEVKLKAVRDKLQQIASRQKITKHDFDQLGKLSHIIDLESNYYSINIEQDQLKRAYLKLKSDVKDLEQKIAKIESGGNDQTVVNQEIAKRQKRLQLQHKSIDQLTTKLKGARKRLTALASQAEAAKHRHKLLQDKVDSLAKVVANPKTDVKRLGEVATQLSKLWDPCLTASTLAEQAQRRVQDKRKAITEIEKSVAAADKQRSANLLVLEDLHIKLILEKRAQRQREARLPDFYESMANVESEAANARKKWKKARRRFQKLQQQLTEKYREFGN